MKTYYGIKRETAGYRGRVYHFDMTGEREIEVYVSPGLFQIKALALDDAAEWLEEHGVEATADFFGMSV